MSRQQKQQHKNQPHNQQKDQRSTYAIYSGLAIQMIAIIGIGAFVGVKLDEHFTKHNLFTIIFSLSAVIISMVIVIRRIIANSK